MTRREIERRLREAATPPPPEPLRERVLRDAAAALPRASRPGRLDRLWFSRGWRLAWAAAVLALLLVEFHVSGRAFGRSNSAQAESVPPLAEVARELDLRPDWRTRVTPEPGGPTLAEVRLELP